MTIETLNVWQASPWFIPVFIIIGFWTLIWKGLALWHAAKNNHSTWFIVLLVLNSAGLLEIIYLIFFSKTFCCKKK